MVTVAVYTVFGVNAADGVSVADVLAALTVAATLVADPAAVSVKLDVDSEAVLIAMLKLAVTVEFTATPVAVFAGVTVVTVGTAPVVKFQL